MSDQVRTGLKLVVVVVFFLLSFQFKNYLLDRQASSLDLNFKLGERMPRFSLPDTRGNIIDVQAVVARNNITLINFWATWCSPCRLEMPELAKVYRERVGNGLEVMAISLDTNTEDVESYLSRTALPFIVLLDHENRIKRLLNVEKIPTTIIVDKNGVVKRVIVGLRPNLGSIIDQWLKPLSKSEP